MRKRLISISLLGIVVVLFLTYTNNHWDFFFSKEREGKCLDLSKLEKEKCWAEELSAAVENEGVSEGIDRLLEFYEVDPEFTGVECHSFAHFIGDRAFEIYKEGKGLSFSEKTHICDYGFYHAFMASLMVSGEGGQEAREFCSRLEKENHLLGVSCYHGIGHGAAYVYDDMGHGPRELVEKGLGLCTDLLKEGVFLKECISGVYGGLGDVYLEKEEEEEYQDLDIVELCMSQKEFVKDSCFEDIAALVVYLQRNHNFSESLGLVSEIETTYQSSFVKGLANVHSYSDRSGGQEGLLEGFLECRKRLTNPLKEECMGNMVSTILQNGPPGEEYVPAEEFCLSESLTDEEEKLCYKRIISDLVRFGGLEEARRTCNSLKDPYADSCLEYYDQVGFEGES